MKECPRTQSGKHRPVQPQDTVNTPYGQVYDKIILCVWCGMVLDNEAKNDSTE